MKHDLYWVENNYETPFSVKDFTELLNKLVILFEDLYNEAKAYNGYLTANNRAFLSRELISARLLRGRFFGRYPKRFFKGFPEQDFINNDWDRKSFHAKFWLHLLYYYEALYHFSSVVSSGKVTERQVWLG